VAPLLEQPRVRPRVEGDDRVQRADREQHAHRREQETHALPARKVRDGVHRPRGRTLRDALERARSRQPWWRPVTRSRKAGYRCTTTARDRIRRTYPPPRSLARRGPGPPDGGPGTATRTAARVGFRVRRGRV